MRVQQRDRLNVDLMLEVGGLEERVVVEASPSSVQFHSSSTDITLEQAADRSGADRRPQPLQPGVARPEHHGVAGDQREPSVPPRLRQRLRRRRRHPPRQRRAARRRPARRQFQDLLHAGRRRRRRSDRVEEQRRRRERPQPGRRHQPEHEVGHQPVPRLDLHLRPRSQPELDQRPDDPPHPRAGHHGAARHRAQDVRRHARRADQARQDLQLHHLRAVGRQAAELHRPHRAN